MLGGLRQCRHTSNKTAFPGGPLSWQEAQGERSGPMPACCPCVPGQVLSQPETAPAGPQAHWRHGRHGGIESEAGPHGWGWGAVEESEKCHTRGGAGGRGNAVEGGQTCHPVPGGDPVLSLDSNQRSVEELIFETTGNVNLLDV